MLVDGSIETSVSVHLTIALRSVCLRFFLGVDAAEHETNLIACRESVLTGSLTNDGGAVTPENQGVSGLTLDFIVGHGIELVIDGIPQLEGTVLGKALHVLSLFFIALVLYVRGLEIIVVEVAVLNLVIDTIVLADRGHDDGIVTRGERIVVVAQIILAIDNLINIVLLVDQVVLEKHVEQVGLVVFIVVGAVS